MSPYWDEQRLGRHLKLRDLHVLAVVARLGSMGRASAALRISQPAISRMITDLERVIGVALFDRTPRGVELTAYGRALVDRSIAAFDELKAGIRDIGYLADPGAGELRIGAPLVIAAGFVTAVIDRLARQYPRIVFHLMTGEASATYGALAERKLDLVVARIFAPLTSDLMKVEVLYNEPHLVVAGAQNPWSRRRHVELADLMEEPWALPAPDSAYGSICVEAFHAAGLELPRATVITYTNPVRNALVGQGRFLTIVPDSALRFSPNQPALKVLPIKLAPSTSRPIGIITLKKRKVSPIAELFITCARQLASSLANAKSLK